MLVLPITAMVRRMVFVFARVSILWIGWLRHGNCTRARGRPFNQLVEFAPIKPDAAALGTVVDFNALAFGHQEVGVGANGAFHMALSCELEVSTRRVSGEFPCLTCQRTESR